MKLNQIFEAQQDSLDLKYARQIVRDCQPYLSEQTFNVHPLYRGIVTSTNETMIKKRRRRDREPLSTTKEMHQVINQWFIDKFGKPYRNGVFATPQPKVNLYGTKHEMFPIDQYSICWSPHVSDLFSSLEGLHKSLIAQGYNENRAKQIAFSNHPQIHQEDIKPIYSYLDSLQFREGQLSEAVNHNTEIMILTDSYYGLHAKPASIYNRTDVIHQYIEQLIKGDNNETG